jgi:hypothetical protein
LFLSLYFWPSKDLLDMTFINVILDEHLYEINYNLTFFLYSTPLPRYPFPPLPYLFHPSYLSSVFAQYFSPLLSLPLSHFVTSAPHVLYRFTLLAAHPAPSLLSFRPIPVLSLLVPAFKSCHHFPLFRALSPQVHRNILCHAFLIILSLLSCLSVSLSLSLSSAHIHLPSALNLSTSSLAYPFLLQ